MQNRTRKLAITEGITAGIFFGTAAIFVRFLPSLDAFSIAFWRLIVACGALAILVIVLKRRLAVSIIGRNIMQLTILGALLALHLIFFVSSVKDTTILNATVLVNTAPIFSMLVSSFVYKKRPSRLALMGLIISFAGASIIAFARAGPSNTMVTSTMKGNLEALLAAAVEALYLNYGRKVRKQMDIISIMLPIYLLSSLAISIFSIPIAVERLMLPTTLQIILPLLGLGLLPTAIAHTLYFSSLADLKSFETATMALIEPIGATLLGIVIFFEVPAWQFVFGAALVLLGVLFVIKKNKREEREVTLLLPQLSFP
jgi:drug/metabolite transporter (DMT)-like permease